MKNTRPPGKELLQGILKGAVSKSEILQQYSGTELDLSRLTLNEQTEYWTLIKKQPKELTDEQLLRFINLVRKRYGQPPLSDDMPDFDEQLEQLINQAKQDL